MCVDAEKQLKQFSSTRTCEIKSLFPVALPLHIFNTHFFTPVGRLKKKHKMSLKMTHKMAAFHGAARSRLMSVTVFKWNINGK